MSFVGSFRNDIQQAIYDGRAHVARFQRDPGGSNALAVRFNPGTVSFVVWRYRLRLTAGTISSFTLGTDDDTTSFTSTAMQSTFRFNSVGPATNTSVFYREINDGPPRDYGPWLTPFVSGNTFDTASGPPDGVDNFRIFVDSTDFFAVSANAGATATHEHNFWYYTL